MLVLNAEGLFVGSLVFLHVVSVVRGGCPYVVCQAAVVSGWAGWGS